MQSFPSSTHVRHAMRSKEGRARTLAARLPTGTTCGAQGLVPPWLVAWGHTAGRSGLMRPRRTAAAPFAVIDSAR